MKIAFAKVANKNIDFELKDKNLNFSGILKRLDPKLVECLGKMKGEISYICDRCGCEMTLPVDQDVKLILSEGIYVDKENELSDTMEFFDGDIDLNEVFKSELEAFKSDYFYCENCRNL
ncbi:MULTISPECIES: hypothetical protein [Campylobacter]|uniref:DUF177 domain-containing protein n=1 Tax=Campylobacter curvus (strain 525.92) TaxID=360105 RepID=A7H052_CAMC5|nr:MULTISPECIES: hypothetical protein [Campylobacter]EAU01056.1 hypothetical protein CCV52592_1701 [Campylobacter curvus 525.92]EJP74848.1 hypothetical protein HMPREF1139_0120 [Campylobacter sp. FOBRC14]